MRRPIETVMQEINDNLESKGHPALPTNRLRTIAERHLDDVDHGSFVQWRRLQARKGKSNVESR